ncbi:hypothetical protein MACK_000537 [Theileria orientalis]|uniref:Uncharacterized protein n=1 Tax=Theileria orientalis TaxID=68886 RepID=A0A976MA42_THEOR|nr:hypothetical protein MACK_000537 [Theileria orientalis]
MEVTLVCDCEDCYSTLIQVGCVNILCDVPFKLLKDFSESIGESANCNFNSSCELYEKLNCSQIHVVLITNARGFQGLNLLSEYYDLSSTHIVCTRPVYVLSRIYYSTKNRKNGVRKSRKSSFYGFGTRRLISNLRETRYRSGSSEFSLLDFLNGNLLHPLSYNEPLKIDLTVSSAYTRHGPLVNALDSGRLNDFSVQLNVVAMSSGYCLGSCNYLIKHENVKERIVYLSKSSTRNRYTRSFDYSIFDDLTPEDVIIVANTVSGGTSNATNGFSTGKSSDIDGGNDGINITNTTDNGTHNGSSDNEMEVKSERKRQVKEELFSDGSESDAVKVESEEADRPLIELEKLSVYCINNVLNGHNVIVPVDFNYEYLIDLFESLNQTIKMMKKQIYVYCLGEGVEEMFDYLDKCCDWVANQRSELTMHSEDPKSPFPDLEEMKNNNQFFYSNSLNGLSSLFREPSVLVMTVKDRSDFMDYFFNENNRFLILQPKYYPYQHSVCSGGVASVGGSVSGTSGAGGGSSHISKGFRDRCVCTSVNLQTSMSNINVNAKVVVLSTNNRHCKLHLDEVNVGYIRAGVKPEVLDKLEFINLFPKGALRGSGTTTGGSGSVGADSVSHSAPRDGSIEFNKFRVDCSNIDHVVLTQLQNDTESGEVSTSDTAATRITTTTATTATIAATTSTGTSTTTSTSTTGTTANITGTSTNTSASANTALAKTSATAPASTASTPKPSSTPIPSTTPIPSATPKQSSTPMPSTTPKKYNKSKLTNKPKSEDPVTEISDDVDNALLFGTYNYSSLVTELTKYFTEKVEVTKTNDGVTLTHSNFKILIGADSNSTLIETDNDKYRKCILKSLQQVLISI